MENLSQYLDMGGYARFIWPAYGLVALVMMMLLVFSVRSLRERARELDGLQNSLGGRRSRPVSNGDSAK